MVDYIPLNKVKAIAAEPLLFSSDIGFPIRTDVVLAPFMEEDSFFTSVLRKKAFLILIAGC